MGGTLGGVFASLAVISLILLGYYFRGRITQHARALCCGSSPAQAKEKKAIAPSRDRAVTYDDVEQSSNRDHGACTDTERYSESQALESIAETKLSFMSTTSTTELAVGALGENAPKSSPPAEATSSKLRFHKTVDKLVMINRSIGAIKSESWAYTSSSFRSRSSSRRGSKLESLDEISSVIAVESSAAKIDRVSSGRTSDGDGDGIYLEDDNLRRIESMSEPSEGEEEEEYQLDGLGSELVRAPKAQSRPMRTPEQPATRSIAANEHQPYALQTSPESPEYMFDNPVGGDAIIRATLQAQSRPITSPEQLAADMAATKSSGAEPSLQTAVPDLPGSPRGEETVVRQKSFHRAAYLAAVARSSSAAPSPDLPESPRRSASMGRQKSFHASAYLAAVARSSSADPSLALPDLPESPTSRGETSEGRQNSIYI